MSEQKLVKVRLTNRGEDTESPWAHDLGPDGGPDGARLVRLANVPFLHAKPTWGDVVTAVPGDDGVLTWDRDGVPWGNIATRIVEDGGRWAMIVDYDGGEDAFAEIAKVCAANDVVCEGAWAPRGADPGRVYLAVKNEVGDAQVMKLLRGAALPCELMQVHPEPIEVLPMAPGRLATIPGAIDPAAAKLPAVPGRMPRAASVRPDSEPPHEAEPVVVLDAAALLEVAAQLDLDGRSDSDGAPVRPTVPIPARTPKPAVAAKQRAVAASKKAAPAAKAKAAPPAKKKAAPAAKKASAPASKAAPATKKEALAAKKPAPAAKKPAPAAKKPAPAAKKPAPAAKKPAPAAKKPAPAAKKPAPAAKKPAPKRPAKKRR